MSKKSSFPKKTPQLQVQPERTLDQIKSEYSNTRALVAEAHLQMKASENQRDTLTQKMANLHNEYTAAEARIKAQTPTEIPSAKPDPA